MKCKARLILAVLFVSLLWSGKVQGQEIITADSGKMGVYWDNDTIRAIYDTLIKLPHYSLYIAYLDGKAGVIGRYDTKVSFENDSLYLLGDRHGDWDDNIYKTKRGDQFGVLTGKGKVLVPCEYDELSVHHYIETMSSFNVRKGDFVGLVERGGNVIVPIEYHSFESHKSGVRWVERDGKFGFLNGTEEIIPLIYDDAKTCSWKMFSVRKGKKWGVLNTNNEFVVPCVLDEVNYFTGSISLFRKDDKWGFVNEDREVIDAQFDEITVKDNGGYLGRYSDDAFRVRVNNKYGMISPTGDTLTPNHLRLD